MSLLYVSAFRIFAELPMARAPLVVITDTADRLEHYGRLIETMGDARLVAVQDLVAHKPEPTTHLLIDVDLTDMHAVLPLRRYLPRNFMRARRILVGPSHNDLVLRHSEALGATESLARTPGLAEFGDLLGARPEAAYVPAPAEEVVRRTAAATQSGARALTGLFEAIKSGGELDHDAVELCGETIMRSIGEAGVGTWLDAVRRHHSGTYQHCLLVTGIATAFGQALGLKPSALHDVAIAGLLHDVGKAMVPTDILDSTNPLGSRDLEMIRMHPVYGYDFVRRQSGLPAWVAEAVRHHHEFLDGSGYPDGLKADAIDPLTRALTIADIFGAMVEKRAYKAPLPAPKAYEHLESLASLGKLDKALVKAFADVAGQMT
jgi:putative nucleotidyltransferase with HDIG domain